MGRLARPTNWGLALLVSCLLGAPACVGDDPDALFAENDGGRRHDADVAETEVPLDAEAPRDTAATSDVSPPWPGDEAETESSVLQEASPRDSASERANVDVSVTDGSLDASDARRDATQLDASDAPSDARDARPDARDARPDGPPADGSSPDAGDCDDGNPCTTDVRLPDGTCSFRPVVCPSTDDCHVRATCDVTTGRCAAAVAPGAVCTEAQGGRCDGAGQCTPTLMVVKVGDGAPLFAGRSAVVTVERRFADSSATLVVEPNNPIALPIAAAGNNLPFSLSGGGIGEGSLSLSADRNYVTLAGYLAPPGTGAVKSTANRVIARINGNNIVDTSTMLTMGPYGDNIRSATSLDGTQFWVAGSGNFGSSGIYYVELGDFGGSAILANPNEIRALNIAGNQLLATSAATLLAVGAGASGTPGQLTTRILPGNAEPYGFAVVDTDPDVPGLDTVYIADDRPLDSGGGIAKWSRSANGAWALVATFSSGLLTGVRGLAALPRGSVVTIIATTTEPSENHLVELIDDGTDRDVTNLADAPLNTVFRGVAFAP